MNYNIAITILIDKHYWLQFSITGSKFCGFIAILQTSHKHVKRYEIGYEYPSCYGNGHMMDSTIGKRNLIELRLVLKFAIFWLFSKFAIFTRWVRILHVISAHLYCLPVARQNIHSDHAQCGTGTLGGGGDGGRVPVGWSIGLDWRPMVLAGFESRCANFASEL